MKQVIVMGEFDFNSIKNEDDFIDAWRLNIVPEVINGKPIKKSKVNKMWKRYNQNKINLVNLWKKKYTKTLRAITWNNTDYIEQFIEFEKI